MNYIYRAYKIIDSIFRDKAFSSIELSHALSQVTEDEKPIITKIVYGVIENSVKYDYIISKLCDKKPKGSICTLLKVGLYMFELSSIPNYTVIDECVKIAKKISKGSLTGFVNAFLRKAEKYNIEYPVEKNKYISVKHSVNLFFVDKLLAQYDEKTIEELLTRDEEKKTCIRVNKRYISLNDFEQIIPKDCEKILDNCYLVNSSDLKNINSKYYTIQALASIIDVNNLELKEDDLVLDSCSAPGGKAIYASETAKEVYACDIHPHRVSLIERYAEKMGAENVKAFLKDGTEFDKEFENKFDKVLLDVPCTGSGVFHEKADILFDLNEDKIKGLNELQKQILEVNSKYIKKGGILVYSTCSILKEENDDIVSSFLENHKEFELLEPVVSVEGNKCEYGVQLLPNISKTVGFYISKLRRL